RGHVDRGIRGRGLFGGAAVALDRRRLGGGVRGGVLVGRGIRVDGAVRAAEMRGEEGEEEGATVHRPKEPGRAVDRLSFVSEAGKYERSRPSPTPGHRHREARTREGLRMRVFEVIIALLLGGAALTALSKRIGAPYPAMVALAGAALALI